MLVVRMLGLSGSAEAAGLVEALLAAAPGVKVMVTSRERLHLQVEHLLEVDGLDYPAAGDEDLECFASVQLFLQTVRRIYSRFSYEAEQASVARICRLTEGMPLAIELTAAWVRALWCHEIAERIEVRRYGEEKLDVCSFHSN